MEKDETIELTINFTYEDIKDLAHSSGVYDTGIKHHIITLWHEKKDFIDSQSKA